MASNILGYHSQLALADRLFTALFYQGLESAAARYGAWIDRLAMTIQTPGVKTVDHNWIGPVPRMTEWKGSRDHAKLRTDGFTLTNKKWANGVEVDGDDVEDDNLSLYAPRIAQLPFEGIRLQWRLLRDLLINGFTSTATYDATAFFSTSHPNHGNAQSNRTNEKLDADGLKAARTRLVNMSDEQGNPLDLTPTHLIVEPSNFWVAKSLLENENDAAGATNTTRKMAEIVEMPGLTTGYWFLADFSQPLKPFIIQNKRSIRPDRMTSPDSPNVYHEDKHFFGASWKGAAGYALWELIQGSDASE